MIDRVSRINWLSDPKMGRVTPELKLNEKWLNEMLSMNDAQWMNTQSIIPYIYSPQKLSSSSATLLLIACPHASQLGPTVDLCIVVI